MYNLPVCNIEQMVSFISGCNRKPTWLDFFHLQFKAHKLPIYDDNIKGFCVFWCCSQWVLACTYLFERKGCVNMFSWSGNGADATCKHIALRGGRKTYTQADLHTHMHTGTQANKYKGSHIFTRLIINFAEEFDKLAMMNSSDLTIMQCYLISSSTPFLWRWFDFY